MSYRAGGYVRKSDADLRKEIKVCRASMGDTGYELDRIQEIKRTLQRRKLQRARRPK